METIQAIRSRRSIRKYQQNPVSHEVIEQIVADATARNRLFQMEESAFCVCKSSL